MQTTAYFENIPEAINSYLGNATHSVKVAVAWFSDRDIFETLCQKAKSGIGVELMIANDSTNFRDKGLLFKDLEICGGRFYIAGKDPKKKFMHNKFCVIDGQTVITGSYNWSYKARQNHENITVTENAPELATQFSQEFERLRLRYCPDPAKSPFDLATVLKRLDLIKNLIALQDIEDIAPQITKLNQQTLTADIEQIVVLLQQQQYANAVAAIEDFARQHTSLTTFVDAELNALKIEIRILGWQVQALEIEKAEVEKNLHDFSVRHHLELGTLILRLLHLRREQAQKAKEEAKNKVEEAQAKVNEAVDDTEREEAEKAYEKVKQTYENLSGEAEENNQDYDQYQETYRENLTQKQQLLDEAQKQTLKKAFRKASVLCHPDLVEENFKEQAHAIFIELNEANQRNDLEKVSEILEKLESGEAFTLTANRIERLIKKDDLLRELNRLHKLLSVLEASISTLKNSETYQAISEIADWNTYFSQVRNELEGQLKELERVKKNAEKTSSPISV
jgi:hypothetical protein